MTKTALQIGSNLLVRIQIKYDFWIADKHKRAKKL